MFQSIAQPLTILSVAVCIVLIWTLAIWLRSCWQAVTIYDKHVGLLYRDGRFVSELAPGRYRIWTPRSSINVQDLREQLLTLGGQEVLTSDSLTIKISLSLRQKIVDAKSAVDSAQNPNDIIYAAAQASIRRAAAQRTLEQILAERGELANDIARDLTTVLAAQGYSLVQLDIRDCMLTSESKKAFSDIFRARKEGEAALERARGETAALRSLANAGRMLKDNPGLLQLRMLQALQNPAQKGATLMLNAAPTAMPFAPTSDSPDATAS